VELTSVERLLVDDGLDLHLLADAFEPVGLAVGEAVRLARPADGVVDALGLDYGDHALDERARGEVLAGAALGLLRVLLETTAANPSVPWSEARADPRLEVELCYAKRPRQLPRDPVSGSQT
jgi:hypothetical protein